MNNISKILLSALAASLLITGCSTSVTVNAPSSADDAEPAKSEEAVTEPAKVEEPDAISDEEATTDPSSYDDPKSLPAYVYQGTEEYIGVIDDYLIDMMKGYNEGNLSDVYIPYGIIVQTDDTDPSDIIAYGAYGIYGYDLLNTTLVMKSGSLSFGAFHLEKNDDGSATITNADLPEVEEESIEVFAPVPGLYDKVTELTDSEIDTVLQEAIAEYVNTNGLNITQWQDYAHKPVAVLNAPETPEEANFYKYDSPLGYEMTYDLRDYSLSYSDNEDMYGKVEPDDVWTGTLMVVKKTDGDDADAGIASALSHTDAKDPASTDATIGDGIACKRAEYDETLEDGRIFRYVCYAVPANGSVLTVVIETTVEKGVSELSVEELENTFASTLATFKVQ